MSIENRSKEIHGYNRLKILLLYFTQEGYCHCEEKDNCTVINFDTISTVKKLDETALKHGLVSFGPASVAINVNKKSFKFYSSGVYDDPDCGKIRQSVKI